MILNDNLFRTFYSFAANFVSNEIDLDMFSTLTEEDLHSLGITAFGPRKKLLMAINFLSTHHPSHHGHLSPQIYHHHPPHNHHHQQQQHHQGPYMQQAAAMGGRLPPGPQMTRNDLKNPPGIPAGFEQKIQQQQQQQQQNQANGNPIQGGSSSIGSAQQQQPHHQPQQQPPQQQKSSPVASAEGSGASGGASGNGVGQGGTATASVTAPKFSGSAAPGAERRTSNSS